MDVESGKDALGRDKFDRWGNYIPGFERGDAQYNAIDAGDSGGGGGGNPTFGSMEELENYIWNTIIANSSTSKFYQSTNRDGSVTVSWWEKYNFEQKTGTFEGTELNEVVVGLKKMSMTLYIGEKSNSAFDIDKAVNTLNNNAYANHNLVPKSERGTCARYVRYAVEAGFGMKRDKLTTLNPRSPVPARDWGPFLKGLGFKELSTTNFLKGDIVVMQGYPGGTSDRNGVPYGHIAMYNGNQWVSYWYQNSIYANSSYRNHNPVNFIYRFN